MADCSRPDTWQGFDSINCTFQNVNVDYAPSLRSYQNIWELFALAVNVIMAVGFSIGLLAITYSFFMYVVSGGNPEKTKRAWDAFIYGVIGTAIALGAVALKGIVLRGFGVDTTGIDEVSQGHY
jgi:hypothetical protein